jgi:hypothetical protein
MMDNDLRRQAASRELPGDFATKADQNNAMTRFRYALVLLLIASVARADDPRVGSGNPFNR